MQLTQQERNDLVALVKSWPGMEAVECTAEPPAKPGINIAINMEWPKALQEKIFEQWPQLRETLYCIPIRYVGNE